MEDRGTQQSHGMEFQPQEALTPRSMPQAARGSLRERLLGMVADKKSPAIIIVAGQSGGGKSYAVGVSGATAAERVMPRPKRDGDFPVDVPWTNDLERTDSGPVRSGKASPNKDEYAPERMFAAQRLYGGVYAFPWQSLLSNLRRGKDGADTAIIIGRAHEVPTFVEAVQNLLPTIPVVVLHVDVPTEVLQGRLSARVPATEAERQERLALLKSHREDWNAQKADLVAIYGLRSILNITEKEAAALGYHPDQVSDITPVKLRTYLSDFVEEAKERAAAWASQILEPIALDFSNPYIPPELIHTLDGKLVPACRRQHLAPCIVGGLAVALLLENARQVSPDIDFTAAESANLEGRLSAAVLSFADAVPVTDGESKAVYHPRAMHTKTIDDNTGRHCEIDALIFTRIQPGDRLFTFQFPFDRSDAVWRRKVLLPSGHHAFVMPPEHIVLQKLVAGRGPDENKFDLFDSAGLLSKYEMHPSLVRKLLDVQEFDARFDAEVKQLLSPVEGGRTVHEVAELLELQNKDLVSIVTQRGTFSQPEDLLQPPIEPSHERHLTIDVWKRVAMIDRLLSSLDRIVNELQTEWDIGAGKRVSLDEHYGASAIHTGVNDLRRLLMYYCRHELGRRDVYARRPGRGDKGFFAGVPEQRARLSEQNGMRASPPPVA